MTLIALPCIIYAKKDENMLSFPSAGRKGGAGVSQASRIETGGFVFDALVAGEGPLVLLLHGFAESLHTWRGQLPALAGAGFRAVAPSQRGYCRGARPDARDPQNYHFDRLVEDAIAVAAACGDGRRFHLVGHDWGGSLAWGIADRYPEKLASLTVLSRPHPNAFNRALALPDGEQQHRSRHHREFLEPDAASVVLADGARWLRERWDASGVPPAAQAEHLSVLGNPEAMEAALAWYRARGAIRSPLGQIRVPTLYIWGDADDTVGHPAAEWTRDYVSGPYQFAVLPGVGHFTADQAPAEVNALLLGHVARYPV
jgi:pimeloyl-ACP methyl ester carboxylesterase